MTLEAVFLDRDGTLIEEVHYLKDPQKVQVLEGVFEALHCLIQHQIPLFIVTNQSGIGRGLIQLDEYEAVHQRLMELFSQAGIFIQKTDYCPYHPESGIGPYKQDSEDRKPKPGMILKACQEFSINPQNIVMVGDKMDDVFAGQNAGGKGVLLLTGYGKMAQTQIQNKRPDYIAENLLDAVKNYMIRL